MRFHPMKRACLFALTCLACLPLRAEVRLPAVFSDHAVLQCEQPIPVWGWAAPGETVTVRFAGQTRTATAGKDGHWQVTLDPMPASAEPRSLTINDRTVKDVLVGEVWLCSGQSNMEMALRESENAEAEIKKATHPQVRLFTAPRRPSLKEETQCAGKWEICSPESAGSFSAVGYYYGRELHQNLHVPIGLIHSSWSGTPAESWMSLEGLRAEPVLKAAVEKRERTDNLGAVKRPDLMPTALYNGMIAPLVPYRVRGVLWYHGGANASGRSAYNYRKTLPALIGDWRRHWGHDFPFYIVQLANVGPSSEDPNRSGGRTLIREAQLKTLSVTNTGLVVTIDLGDGGEKHPKNKLDVGKRASLLALAKAYEKPIEYSGPIYDGMTVEGSKIRIRFQHVGGGLVARDSGKLKRFAIAGADRKFVWAEAVIDGGTVVVSSEEIDKPVAARYAWAENPAGCNLANQAGLPASPFRTDDW